MPSRLSGRFDPIASPSLSHAAQPQSQLEVLANRSAAETPAPGRRRRRCRVWTGLTRRRRTRPVRGRSRPAIRRRSVVLPDPLGPESPSSARREGGGTGCPARAGPSRSTRDIPSSRRTSISGPRRAAERQSAPRLTTKDSASSTSPSASARSTSPRLVSVTIAVVSTRVLRSRLPPTIIEAPTSETIAPKAAMIATSSPSLASRASSHSVRSRPAPSTTSRSGSRGGSDWNDAVVNPTTMGVAIRNWASTIARWV